MSNAPAVPTPAESPAETLRTAALLVVATLLTLGAMAMLRDVLVPFVVAVFLAMLLNPLVDALVRRARWPRPVAVAVTFVMGTLLLAAVVAALVQPASTAVDNLLEYARSLDQTTRRVLDALPFDLPDAARDDLLARVDALNLRQAALSLLPFVGTAGGGLMSLLANAGLVLVFLLFLLLGRGDKPVPAQSARGLVERRIQAYLAVTLTVSAATGLLVGLTLWLLGVRGAWVFGAAAFVLNFIPVVGSALATLLPIPFVLFGQALPLPAVVAAVVVPASIQFVLGNVVAPKLLGDVLSLSPVAVMLGLILLGSIWGLPGMVLSTPLLSVLAIAVDKAALDLPLLRPVSDALAGRPAAGGAQARPPASTSA